MSSYITPSPRLDGSSKSDSLSVRSAELSKRNIAEIIERERLMRENCDQSERVISRLTHFCGSVWFISIHFVWFVTWIAANLLLPLEDRWDPYPFTFITLLVSLEAIFLSSFILLTEKKDAAVSERRMHLDLQINLLAEQESTRMLILLDRISERLGIREPQNQETAALEQKTDPAVLLREIDDCLKKTSCPTSPSV